MSSLHEIVQLCVAKAQISCSNDYEKVLDANWGGEQGHLSFKNNGY